MISLRRISLVVAALAISLSGCSDSKLSSLPSVPLSRNGTVKAAPVDPCGKAERCVIGYFAPWCPHCQKSVSFLKLMRDELAHVSGVKIVYIVGDANYYDQEEFAYLIGGEVYLDRAFKFQEAVAFDSLPHFWVIDRNRKVLADFSGETPNNETPAAVRDFAINKLGLASYLDQSAQ